MDNRAGIKKNLEMIGQTYGVLTVLRLEKLNHRTQAICKCICGKERHCEVKYLKERASKVCGCHLCEVASLGGKASKKHGEVHTRLYQIWENARQRCRNPNSPGFKYYGGRGIKFSDNWDDFLTFKQWSIKNGYNEGLTLERVNVDGNYEANNCKWITNFQQQANTRKNRKAEYNGEILHLSEWARRLNISKGDVIYHLNKGKTIKEIIDWFNTPLGLRKSDKSRRFSDDQIVEIRKLSIDKNCKELSEIYGTSASNIQRIVKGLRYTHIPLAI